MDLMRTAAVFVFVFVFVPGPVFCLQAPDPKTPEQTWTALHQAGFAAYQENRIDDAIASFRAALPLAVDPAERAATLNDLGNSLRAQGRFEEAAANLQSALASWLEADRAGAFTAQTAMSLANVERNLNRFTDAERTLRSAIDAHPRDKRSQAALLNSLGDLLREQVRLVEARETLTAALDLSPDPGPGRIDALIGLADVERSSSEWHSAIEHFNRAIALSREASQEETEAIALRGLGKTYADSGDLARAEPLLKRALAMFERIPQLRSQSAATLAYVGGIYRDQKKYGLAEAAFQKALEMHGGLEHASDPQSGAILELLAGVSALEKRFDDANRYTAAAMKIMLASFPPDSPPISGAIGAEAFVEDHAGNLEAAAMHYSDALRIMRLNGIAESTIGADYMAAQAHILRRLHRAEDAKTLETQIKALRQSALR